VEVKCHEITLSSFQFERKFKLPNGLERIERIELQKIGN